MKSLALWIGRQFDDGLTAAGALIALLLMGTAIGALLALASASMVLAALLGVPFVLLLGLAFLAAHYTDPNLRMSQQERRARWNKAPGFMKRAMLLFAGGALAPLLLEGRLAHLVSWALVAVSVLLFAEGVRRERPPLPRAGGDLLTDGGSPSEYKRLWKQTLWGLYFSAVVAALIALLVFR